MSKLIRIVSHSPQPSPPGGGSWADQRVSLNEARHKAHGRCEEQAELAHIAQAKGQRRSHFLRHRPGDGVERIQRVERVTRLGRAPLPCLHSLTLKVSDSDGAFGVRREL